MTAIRNSNLMFAVKITHENLRRLCCDGRSIGISIGVLEEHVATRACSYHLHCLSNHLLALFIPEDGGRKINRKIRKYLPINMASCSFWLQFSSTPLWPPDLVEDSGTTEDPNLTRKVSHKILKSLVPCEDYTNIAPSYAAEWIIIKRITPFLALLYPYH